MLGVLVSAGVEFIFFISSSVLHLAWEIKQISYLICSKLSYHCSWKQSSLCLVYELPFLSIEFSASKCRTNKIILKTQSLPYSQKEHFSSWTNPWHISHITIPVALSKLQIYFKLPPFILTSPKGQCIHEHFPQPLPPTSVSAIKCMFLYLHILSYGIVMRFRFMKGLTSAPENQA